MALDTRGTTGSWDEQSDRPEITTAYLFQVLRAAYDAEFGTSLFDSFIAVIRVLDAAEDARAKLAVQEFVTVELRYMTADQRHLKVGLSRTALLNSYRRTPGRDGQNAR